MKSKLKFQIFKEEDYSEYYKWFRDDDLNDQLGPMEEEDDEWLAYVVQEQKDPESKGCTYSVYQYDRLVSVIGITYPNDKDTFYVITNIAVNPAMRSNGIGRRVVESIFKLHSLREGQSWIAFVDEDNPKAKLFFENMGWICANNAPDANGMFLLEFGKEK